MSAAPQPPPPPMAPAGPPRAGRLVAGLLLVLFGVGWLLEVLEVADFPWDVLLPVALIVVGGALIVIARSGANQAGLVTTGVVLTVVLFLGSAVDFPLGGGVGERDERPTTAAQLDEEFRLGIGRLTVDLGGLSSADVAGTPTVRARVGIGQLVVVVPGGVPVRVEARAALGNVQVFDVEGSGLDVQRVRDPSDDEEPLLRLVVSVGLGQVEVRRG